ncbi:MAG: hypothetical protein YK1309IOTA_1090010 [Marine Group I thaumarchaeote]|nr:MAG: hypothetical protein YK1309IOTA_1090010 [Marine Group I thaumarchaeote]
MGKWDDREKRDSNREEFNHKIGKFMLISVFIGLAFYLSYIIPEFFPNSFEFVK